ncbi:sigma 54-interacting transcriptional regulator [Brevibacillus ruminantium]|uniref:HTH-type transcriptional regulatory protein TyrR n=1 Tax=Brevibacillus ruminantium TaxID=2950604 RepID=A0ABY4W858_9BACL|nr:sigma 54-interacting transcriptional regulator [Brevibacillus ruminantium]USG63358.1 sigma 54-interacting transcriptional regulator [Brevibacillus ruminantium]
MLFWKDVLQTVSIPIPKDSSLLFALQSMEEQKVDLLFVCDELGEIVGYVDKESVLKQLQQQEHLDHRIAYRVDIVKVPEQGEISFYHNISVVLGVNEQGMITGYSTTKDTKNRLDRFQLQQFNEDLKAVYSSASEQITVVDQHGTIIRVAGLFLKGFWQEEKAEQLIGKNLYDMEKERQFSPNVAELCLTQKKRVSLIQESKSGRKVWSVATPVFHGDKIEKVVILSEDITGIHELRAELELARKESNEYKKELDQLLTQNKGDRRKLIFRSHVMERLVDECKHIAKVDSTVLLSGESGVGKEVFARAIHEYSHRRNEPFIRVNCGAIPETLMESELFGYEKGAFTGADQRGKPGLFELAHKGSIFLDEVTELPYNMQVKLLRVLQEREIMRVGGTRTISVDVRVIAATNQNIHELVRKQLFREDLYYRLNVIPIQIPPLRQRVLDIIPLTVHFLQVYNRMYKLDKTLTKEAFHVLEGYHWPGNVRELQNLIERLVVTTRGEYIGARVVLAQLYGERQQSIDNMPIIREIMPLKEAVEKVEEQLISLALQKYGTAAKAAEILGVSPATLSRRMHKLLF